MTPTLFCLMLDDCSAEAVEVLQQYGHLPNLQALRAQGMTFSNAIVASPLCCPARASFLSGLFPSAHGVLDNAWPEGGARKFVGGDANALPVWLKAAGFKTGYVGKYLNVFPDDGLPATYIPPGYDEFRVLTDPIAYKKYTMYLNGVAQFYGSGAPNYSTTVLTDHAIDIIDGTDAETPLFLTVSYNAPHAPSTSTPEDIAAVGNIPAHRPPSFNEQDRSDKPLWVRNLSSMNSSTIAALDAKRRAYLATMLEVDRGLGAIKDALVAAGRWDDAVVLIVSSDNGFVWGEHAINGEKKVAYEGCIRVPLVIKAPTTTGTTEDRMVSALDLTATLVDYACTVPGYPLAGVSLRPLLEGTAGPWQEHVFIEWLGSGRPKFIAVREASLVFIDYASAQQGTELYDLSNDPDQLTNLTNDPAYAADKARLQALIDAR